jgi:hypothetical protein
LVLPRPGTTGDADGVARFISHWSLDISHLSLKAEARKAEARPGKPNEKCQMTNEK